MNLELSEQEAFFQEPTHRFLTSEAPLSLVRDLHPSDDGFDRAWWRRGADLGWTSLLAPEEHGGGSLSGRPVADAAIVAEELGRMVSPGPFLCTNLAVAALTSWGSGQQQATWLPPLVTGDTIGSWALAEPGSRWDVTDITTEATVDGDDIVVHGTKAYVEAAPVADVFVVVARTQRGVSQIAVPAGTAGLTVRPCRSVDLVRRFGEVQLDAVRLPRSALLGEPGDATAAVERLRQVALALQCAETVGAMDSVFRSTLAYMGDRYAFGRPIASFQALKHRVADLLLQLESAKATTDAAVTAIDDGADEAPRLASIARPTWVRSGRP